jgi:hypothetical protein
MVLDIEKQWKYASNSKYVNSCFPEEWLNETV